MRKVRWPILIISVLLIVVGGIYWKSLVYTWWIVRSDSPVVWKGVEISFPKRFIYVEENGNVEKLTFGDFMHIPGAISFVKFEVKDFDESMSGICNERGFLRNTALLRQYGTMNADVNYCTDLPEKEENIWLIAYRDVPLMAMYYGPQDSFSLFEPILHGVRFVD